jgi:hypothetical protein
MMYLLDANVFIEAKNRYYGFELCPGFWDWLEVAHDGDVVVSIEKVRDELDDGADELTAWAQARVLSWHASCCDLPREVPQRVPAVTVRG